MKWMLVVLMMLCPVVVMGQTGSAAPTKAVTGEFPLTVHVVSSRIEASPGYCGETSSGVVLLDLLRVTIGGKKYVLADPIPGRSFPYGLFARSRPVLIEPGDYSARLTEDKQPNPGEVERTYELSLANGKTVRTYLWGVSE